ncbi:MAG TPA: sulfatase-like hydrolase/transferase [Bacteroidales bacterium]|nr:sulfatase-like hydrolase/transferase [Bacteroidales bacterium]
MRKTFLIACIIIIPSVIFAQQTKTKNLILVTIDGLRWQEVFTGADGDLISNKDLVGNQEKMKSKYWDKEDSVRRFKLMPFMWKTINNEGQLYGNRNLKSLVNVTNKFWFSYPGYNELLTGSDDPDVNTNEFGPNKNKNVFEFLAEKNPGLQNNIAVFASWSTLNDILNENRSPYLINAGFEKLKAELVNPEMAGLNEIQFALPDVFDGIRLDGSTFYLGFSYLKAYRPNILYLSFDETDDFAHQGKYDLYLNSVHYTDQFLADLWEWIQSDPEYRDKTTLLVTCDHGRGKGNPDWRNHGSDTPGSDETWFAVIGPDTPALGETKNVQCYTNQLAATISALLGYEYVSDKTAGKPVLSVMGK